LFSNLSNLARASVVPLVILVVWSVATISGYTPSYVLPSPLKVAQTFWSFVIGGGDQAFSGMFWQHFLASLQRVALGFFVGAGLAIPLGIALGYSRTLALYFEPFIELTRAIPGICWLPLALIWFGVGTATSVFLISLGSFYAVLISTLQGVKYVDINFLRAGRSLGASERDILTTIIFPAAFPSILSGLRIGLSYSWVYMVLGEFTGVNLGLGATLLQSRETLDTDLIIVIMILIGVIGYVSDYLMMLLTRKAMHA
jgi:sulfonate transport system permease protein